MSTLHVSGKPIHPDTMRPVRPLTKLYDRPQKFVEMPHQLSGSDQFAPFTTGLGTTITGYVATRPDTISELP